MLLSDFRPPSPSPSPSTKFGSPSVLPQENRADGGGIMPRRICKSIPAVSNDLFSSCNSFKCILIPFGLASHFGYLQAVQLFESLARLAPLTLIPYISLSLYLSFPLSFSLPCTHLPPCSFICPVLSSRIRGPPLSRATFPSSNLNISKRVSPSTIRE